MSASPAPATPAQDDTPPTDEATAELRMESFAGEASTVDRAESAAKIEARMGVGESAQSLHPRARKALVKAIKALKKHENGVAAMYALKATELAPKNGQTYHVLAMALEGLGQLSKALNMYERAVALDPGDADLYLNLGLVAWRLKMLEGAEKMFRLFITMRPQLHSGYNNLAMVLRDQGRFEESIEIMQAALYRLPGSAELWNTLGAVVMERGQVEEAKTFYQEALRLNPRFARAYHNLGYTLHHIGPVEEALDAYERALRLTPEHSPDRVETRHGKALCLLGLGRLEEGFAEWEVRHDGRFRNSMLVGLKAPRWQGEPLAGKRVLVVAEQGVGDEIMFGNALPDLQDALGPEGEMLLAVDQRLVTLYARSLGRGRVGPHMTRMHNGKLLRLVPWNSQFGPVDYWTTMGSTLRFFRKRTDDFENGRPLLKPDPERLAHWRQTLGALSGKPKVGICWRSLSMTTQRAKYFSPMELWGPVLTNPDVTFVNLQYGDCHAELAEARARHGVEIHALDIDLKNALDDNAALCAALDLVISAPTAAAAIAGGVGTELWYLTIGEVWPMLGTDHFPWYPNNRVLMPDSYADWPNLMAKAGAALSGFVAGRAGAPAG
ncbi:MAG: tetratricopeptide repeat protein [Alphaproteobacteria bacterium]|nr:tetratricopeptide repeat protein [Alphaproteobacteria bacterium]